MVTFMMDTSRKVIAMDMAFTEKASDITRHHLSMSESG